MAKPSLDEVLDILHEIAPLELAADWDNVGLLLRPNQRAGKVARIMLCIDLTEAVVAEARAAKADLVIAYHPPIFKPLSRLDANDATQRRVLAAVAAGFAVYSPHTALDAAAGGLADWLLEGALGDTVPQEVRPLGEGEFGRLARMAEPIAWSRLLVRLKKLFAVRNLQIARPATARTQLRSLAIAAGSGGSVLRSAGADVLVTGEMSHHEVLAAVAEGASVVLAGHGNTERGFLKVLGRRLSDEFGQALDVRLSREDRDPLTIV